MMKTTGQRSTEQEPDPAGRTPHLFWSILVPGMDLWRSRARQRAAVIVVSCLSSAVMAAATWGHPISFVFLGYAFLVHLISATEVLSRRSFPGFSTWMPRTSLGLFLASTIYFPIVLAGVSFAWPGLLAGDGRAIFLVNRGLYRMREPRMGDRVWIEEGAGKPARLARVIAGSGQELDWSPTRLMIDGQDVAPDLLETRPPGFGRYRVPEDHLLIHFDQNKQPDFYRDVLLIHQSLVAGKVWAKYYPIWERQLVY